MKLLVLLSLVFIFLSGKIHATVVFSTDPWGFVKLRIEGGTGSTKKVTLTSVPLHGVPDIKGAIKGVVSSYGTNSVTYSFAGWESGELSNPAQPYVLVLTSGEEEGRMFLISSAIPNSSDTVYFDHGEMTRQGSLTELNLNQTSQDEFQILPVETLSSFFGTPDSTLIKGGEGPHLADNITILNNGSAVTYYFSTNLDKWVRISLGSPDSSHVPLLPHFGIQYSRLHNTPIEFLIMGHIPLGDRVVPIKESGPTMLSSYWPMDMTISSIGIHNIDGWRIGSNSRDSDVVVASSGGSISSFFYDGSNWRRVSLGNPLSNNFTVPLGSSLLIQRKGNSIGYSKFIQNPPY
jgi:hypothetical protein